MRTATRLILIRHGRPEWRLPSLLSLREFEASDYDATCLSDEGKQAIGVVAKRLPNAVILSSDLLRARETAEIIARESGMPIEFDPVFRELQGPRLGMSRLGKMKAPPRVWGIIHRGCWLLGIGACAEGPRAGWQRAAQAANQLAAKSDETVILVSHGAFITMLAFYLRRQGWIEHGPLLPDTTYGGVTEYVITSPKHGTNVQTNVHPF